MDQATRTALAYKEYKHNPKYREYVDKYCHMHGLDLDEAIQHHIVQVEAYNYYSDL